jgi:hypothetical protein
MEVFMAISGKNRKTGGRATAPLSGLLVVVGAVAVFWATIFGIIIFVIGRSLMQESENNILCGINNIRPILGNASEHTIMKWKREYQSFPIRKLGGQWVSHRTELVEWFRRLAAGDFENKD